MNLLALGLVLNNVTEGAAWSTCSSQARLIFREGREGCGYVDGNEVVLLDGFGKPESRVSVDEHYQAMYETANGELIISSTRIIAKQLTPSGISHSPADSVRLFSRERAVFGVSTDVTLLSGTRSVAFPKYGRESAVGVSLNGKMCAYLSNTDSGTSTFRQCSLSDSGVVQDTIPSPRVREIGNCALVPRFNDLTFLGTDFVAFIGAIAPPYNPGGYEGWSKKVADLTRFSLDAVGRNSICFLFVTHLSSGYTKAVAKLSYNQTAEPGGPREGCMVLSGDGKWLYVRANRVILRFGVASMASREGL